MTTPSPQDGSDGPGPDRAAATAPRAAPTPEPDLGKLRTALARGGSIGIMVLATLAVLYTMYFARAFLIPIAFAVLFKFLLSPIIRLLGKLRVPPALAAGVVMITLVGLLGAGVYALSEPAQEWTARAPRALAAAGERLRELRRPVEQVRRTAEQVESTTKVGGTAAAREVVIRGPSLVSRAFGTTEAFVAGLLEVIILLYFLLAGGDLFLHKLIRVLPQFRDKMTAVRIARETERSISVYLTTLMLLNVIEGIAVTGVMVVLGMPNATLWGVLAALFDFIPYLGAAAMVAILSLAAFTTFDQTGHALLVPASYLAINLVQGSVLSPLMLGHRLTLNPVAILIGLALWFFLWGIPGAFLAVPLLAAFKILCDHIEALAPIGEFLGRREEMEVARAPGA